MDTYVPPQALALNSLKDAIDSVNSAITRAVESGVSVEVIRASRCHDGQGHWGDQIDLAFRDPKN